MGTKFFGVWVSAAAALSGLLPFGEARAATATAETEPFRLSVRHDGVRASAGDEVLRRSNLWSGDAAATVTLAQDGVPLAEGLAGEGAFGWHVAHNGTYTLTHTTYTNGVAGTVETAVFVVTGRDVPFADGDVTVSGWSGRYDGAAHGVSVTLADGITDATVEYARVSDKGGTNESSSVGGGGGSGTAVDDVPSPPVGLAWTATPPAFTDAGAYTVWCAIVAPGYLPVTNSATVSISPRTVTLTSGSAGKTYDGFPVTCADIHVGGDGFAPGEGATYDVKGSQTAVGESTNTFTYALNENTKPSNYTIATTFGTLTVTKATIGGGGSGAGGEEPGTGAVPEGGLSKFDTSAVYDGLGHTVDTNALVAAFRTAIAGDFTVEYAVGTTAGRDVPVAPQDDTTAGGGAGRAALPENSADAAPDAATPPEGLLWSAIAPVFTNAGEYVVWYRVSSPNYEAFAHAAKVVIAKRPATLTSGDGAWTYDGAAHSNAVITAEGFVDGEGVVPRDFATITDVGTKPNVFDYDFLDGTLAANYSVTCATGTLAVAAADLGGWTDVAKWAVALAGDGETYDGAAKTCRVTGLSYGGFAIPSFTVSGNAATDAGEYTLTVAGAGNFAGTHSVPWSIAKRTVALTSGSASKVYDGTSLVKREVSVGGDGFASGEGATYDVTGSQTAVGESTNTFAYALNANTKAANYTIAMSFGTLTVTKATLGGGDGGGEELGDGTIAEGGLSKFDVAVTYDGLGHTLDTNALVAAFRAATVGEFTVEYVVGTTVGRDVPVAPSGDRVDGTAQSGDNGGAGRAALPDDVTWTSFAPSFTNAGEHVVWYRVSSPNYEDFAHAAKVAIVPRPATLTSGSASKVYDGTSLVAHEVTVGGDGFALGEGATYDVTGSQTVVGESANTFDYALDANTKASNYAISTAFGTLVVTKATLGGGGSGAGGEEPGAGTIPEDGLSKFDVAVTYDGLGHTLDTNALVAAFRAAIVGGFTVEYAVGTTAGRDVPVAPQGDTTDDTMAGGGAGRAALPEDGTGTMAESVYGTEAAPDAATPPDGLSWSAVSPAFTNAGGYVVWYRVTSPNYEAFAHAAKVVIAKRPATLTSGDGAWTYDGAAHSNATVAAAGFVDGEGVAARDFATIQNVGEKPNSFAYDFLDGTLAANYSVTCATGTLTVTKATIGGGDEAGSGAGGEEPGDGTVPEGGLSKFDVAVTYDGLGHTVDTNALVAAFRAATVGEFTVEYAVGTTVGRDVPVAPSGGATAGGGAGRAALPDDATWTSFAPSFTNAGEYAVWYRVSSPNYTDFAHAAKVAIAPRPATLTSGDGAWTYDGAAHSNAVMTAEGFVDVEGVVAHGFATIVDAGEKPNAFAYDFLDGTLAANYAVTCATGTLAVAAADLGGWTDAAKWSVTLAGDGEKYDGAEKTCRVAALSYDGFAIQSFTVSGNAATDAGNYTLTVAGAGNFAGTHSVPWSILPRTVTLTSGSASKVYDGTALTNGSVAVAGDGFAPGEGATYDVTGSQTVVGESTNTFTYALNENTTKASNYTVSTVCGTLAVTPATLDADAVFGGCETDAEGRLVCERVYNGAPRPFEVAPDFGEPCRILYATADGGGWSETAPTRTHVAEGDLVVRFKLTSHNYAPYYGTGVLRIAPKTLEAEMVVADEDAAWFFDGTGKKPSVTVVDGNPNIASTNDWTVAYSDRTGAGLFPVTVAGTNDYRGTVTKEFAILKRPVAPPVIPSKAYSGRLQRPSIPSDVRWALVANPGGTDAGDYSNVVLRLASPEDYRWKGLGEDETDWTGVFTIRRGANGWSVYPGISSWTNGVDAAAGPQGRPRFGTLSVAYRRRGAPVAEETSVRPSAPGRYTARFWAEGTANYAGVALSAPCEVDFEVFPGPDDPPAGAATATTPVPVPLAWLEPHAAKYGAGDCEAAANAAGANGVPLWQSYVAGLDPDDPDSRLVALISVGADGVAHVAWAPDLSAAEPPRRYTVLGKARLGDAAWTPVTDANRAGMRFFKVRVEME